MALCNAIEATLSSRISAASLAHLSWQIGSVLFQSRGDGIASQQLPSAQSSRPSALEADTRHGESRIAQ